MLQGLFLGQGRFNFRLLSNQNKLHEAFMERAGGTPLGKLAETNMAMFKAATSAFMPGGKPAEPAKPASGNDDLAALREQMAAMQKKLDELGKTYEIEFDNAFGIVEGGDLKIGGVKAGTTTGFKLDRKSPSSFVAATAGMQIPTATPAAAASRGRRTGGVRAGIPPVRAGTGHLGAAAADRPGGHHRAAQRQGARLPRLAPADRQADQPAQPDPPARPTGARAPLRPRVAAHRPR